MMESVIVRLICDGDLCARFKTMQKLREKITLQDAENLYEMYKAPGSEGLYR